MSTVLEKHESASAEYIEADAYIDYQIEKTRSGVKSTDMLTASVGVLTLFLGYLLAFVICDHWVVRGGFAPWMRVVMLSAVGGGCAAWLILRVVRPYLKSVNSLYAARIIEENNPELRSTLLNLVDLSEAGKPVPEAIRNTLQKRAAVALAHTDIDQAVDRRPLMRTMYVLLAIVVIGCAYTLLTPKKISASVLRALLPLSEKSVSTQTEILDVKPGDVEILARAQVEVTVDLKGQVPPRVVLYFSTSDRKFVDSELELRQVEGATKQYRGMIAGENGRGILQDMTYRIEAGDATSRDFSIKVQQPPSARVDSVQYDFPAYMEFAPKSEPGPAIDGWEGTVVTVTATANMPVKSATIYLSDAEDASQKTEELRMEVVGDTKLRATWPLAFRSDDKSGEKKSYAKFYRVQVRNENGNTDPQPAFHGITIRPDKRPEVRLIDPANDLDRPANAIVPLMVAARDDFKLKSVRVRVQKNGDDMPFEGTLLDATQPAFATAPPFEFHLKRVNAKPGDVLSYWVEARDNRSTQRHPEGQISNTPKLSIRVTEAVEPAEVAKQLQDDKQRQEEKLDEIRQQADENPADAPLDPMDDLRRPDEPDRDRTEDRPPERKPNDPADPAEKSEPRRERPNEAEKAPAEQNPPERNAEKNAEKQDGQQNGGEGKSGEQKPGAQQQKGGRQDGAGSREAKPKETGENDKEKTRQAGTAEGTNGKSGGEKASNEKPGSEKKPGDEKGADGSRSADRTAKDGPSESKPNGQRGAQNDPKKLNPDDSADDQEALEKILQREREKQRASDNKPGDEKPPAAKQDNKDQADGNKPGPSSDKPGDSDPAGKSNPQGMGDKPQTDPSGENDSKPQPGNEKTGKPDGQNPETRNSDNKNPNGTKPESSPANGDKPGTEKPPGAKPEDDPKGSGKPGDSAQPNGEKPTNDKPGAEKPSADKPGQGETPDIKKPNGEPLDKKNDKPDQKPGDDKTDSKKPTGKAPEEGNGDKKPKEGVGGSKDKPMQEAPGGSDNGKPDGKPSPDGNTSDKPRPNEGGGSPSKNDSKQPMPMPGDKPLQGEETPSEDSKDSRKQKATGDETGKATPDEDPNSDPTKAKYKLDRDPDKKPVKRPGEPEGDPRKVERRKETAPDGARNRDPNASSAKSDKESPEGAPDPSGKPANSGEKSETGKPGEKSSDKGQPQDGKSKDGMPQEGKPGEGAPSKEEPGKPGDQNSKDGQPQPGQPGEGDPKDAKPGEGQPQNGKPNSKPGSGDPKGKSDSKSDGKSSEGKPAEGGKPGAGKPGGDPKDGNPSGQSPDKAGEQPRGNSGDSEIGAGGDGQGSSNSGKGGSGGGAGDGEAANPEDSKKAANLVLKQLQDQLQRGDVDEQLLKDLGWTEEEMKRFVSRLDKQINDPADDQSPAAQARRRQFEETLKSLDLRSSARRRKGSESAKPDADGGIGPRRTPIPAEYRDLYEGYTRDLSKLKPASKAPAPKK